MQDPQILLGVFQLLRGEDVAVLQAEVILLIEEAFLLDAGHVQDIQLRHDLLQTGGLGIGNVLGLDVLLLDVAGQLQLLRGDKHEPDAGVAAHGSHQRMDRPAKLQVTAEADGQVVEMALFLVDGDEVRQGLGGVVVAAVTGVDHRHQGVLRCHQRRALLGVAHGDDVAVGADHPDGVRHALALGGGGAVGGGEAQHLTAQGQHGTLKAQAGAGGGFKEQRCQDLAVALVGVCGRIRHNVAALFHQLVDLLGGQLHNIDQIFHISPFLHESSFRQTGYPGISADGPRPPERYSPPQRLPGQWYPNC